MTQKRKLSKNSTGIKKVPEGKKPGENKRALKDFLASEEGFVSKETILKIGLATIAGVGMMAGMAGAWTHSSHPSHASVFTVPIPSGECPTFAPTHDSATPHTSHASY